MGALEKRSKAERFVIKTVFWIIAIGIVYEILTRSWDAPPTTQAVSYTIIQAHAWDNFGDRVGEIVIFSNAQSFEERAHTTLKAAVEYSEREKLTYVRAHQLPSNEDALLGLGYTVARAEYIPGGEKLKHGDWEASAYRGVVDPLEVEIALLWESMRGEYQLEDASGTYTDESALREAIHRTLAGAVALNKINTPLYLKQDL